MFIETSKLPSVVRQALEGLGYGQKDVSVEGEDLTELSNHSYGDGYRAYTCLLNLATGERQTAWGSWGGDNMFSRNPMDKGERPGSKLAQIAGVTAVIKGQEGGGHTSGTQRYKYERDPEGEKYVVSKRVLGGRTCWKQVGHPTRAQGASARLGKRSEHYDFNY